MSKNKRVGQVVKEGMYEGYPTIGIWDVNADGEVVGKKPVIAFGYNKAKAIVDNIDEICNWVLAQEEAKAAAQTAAAKKSSATTINVENLTPADLKAVEAFLKKSRAQ
jgi:spore germination protein YaaH